MCFSSSRKSTNSWNASGTSSSHFVSELEICIIRYKRFENRPILILKVKGLKLEGEVDMTVSFHYLVMPDKLMKARSLYGEGLLFLYCQKLRYSSLWRSNFWNENFYVGAALPQQLNGAGYLPFIIFIGVDLTSHCWQNSAVSMFYFRTNYGSCLFTISERFDLWLTVRLS